MEKFFQKMNKLPIVRLLQASAGIILIIQFLMLMTSIYPMLIIESNSLSLLNIIFMSTSIISQTLYEPLILLGVAEIIKCKSLMV